jgi:uncharacterized protein
MRSFVLFLLVGASAFAQERASPPIDPAKLALIEDLLSLMKADQITGQILTQVEQAMKPQIEKIPAVDHRSERIADLQAFENQVFGVIRERLDYAKVKPEYVRLYDETFTAQELTGIVTFYRSPAGQAYLQKLPELTSKSVELASRIMGNSMQEVQAMTAAWSESMKKKYGDAAAH